MYVRKAMNINSKATSAILDSLFRLVWDGSKLHGAVGARHRGAVGAVGKHLFMLFMLLDRSQGAVSVLSVDRLISLRGDNAPRTSLLCRANEPKHETYCDVRPGSVLAL